jgi:hypothetical protein
LDLRDSSFEREVFRTLRAEHFSELRELNKDKPWRKVPLGLWAPVISRAELSEIRNAGERLCHKLLELGLRERRHHREQQWLPSLPGLLESVTSDPVHTDPAFHWRFDFHWDRERKTVRFLELNAGDPSGMGWLAGFGKTLREHSLWRPFFSQGGEGFDLFSAHRKALTERLGGSTSARLGFLCAENSTVASDIASLAAEYTESGWPAQVLEPRKLSFQADGVFHEGGRYDVLFRDTYEELFWPPYQDVGPQLTGQTKKGNLLLLNPLCATLWDSKTLWSELAGVPDVPTTVPLEKWVQTGGKQHWVLKPAFDYGGRGVLCGFACTLEVWKKGLEKARNSGVPWVVQEAARTPKVEVPILGDDGRVAYGKSYLTWSAYFNNGRFSGLMARSSSDPVVNVHNGGSIFPVFIEP